MLEESSAIRSPADLAARIRWIRQEVVAGRLRQLPQAEGALQGWSDIRSLPAAGPWPDYIELDFVDVQTGSEWTLVAETYHGTGGEWRRKT